MDNLAWFLFGIIVGQQVYAFVIIKILMAFIKAQKSQGYFLEQ